MVCVLAICFCENMLHSVSNCAQQSGDTVTHMKCEAAIDRQWHVNSEAATHPVFVQFVPSLCIHH